MFRTFAFILISFWIHTYIDKRMGIWNIAKNFRVFATNFSTYFVSLKYLICANLVSSFFYRFICCQNITTIRCSLLWCLINFTLSIKNTIVIQIYKLDPSVLVRILIREITIFSPREKAFFPASSPRIQIRDATSNCVFNRSVCETLPGGHVFVESADDFV